MATIEKSIEVSVPQYVAYNQWTSFDEYPKFMQGVKEVTWLGAKRYRWKATIAGQDPEWDAEVTEQTERQRVAMTYRGGAIKGWVATFHELSKDWSKVTLQVEYDPQGLGEHDGDASEALASRVQGDLERFRAVLESRGRTSPFADWKRM